VREHDYQRRFLVVSERACWDICIRALLNRNMDNLSRREFLKCSALLSAGMAIDVRKDLSANALLYQSSASTDKLGRVLSNGSNSFYQPKFSANVNLTYQENDVLSLQEALIINQESNIKSLWYRLEDNSYLHSREIQPVVNQLNAPNLEVGGSGRLAEVTVPFTDAWSSSSNGKKPNQIFYFGTVHWVYGLGQDEEKNYYYMVKEDRWSDLYYVDASHMRIISEEELQPISPLSSQDEKKISIDLRQQLMIAYENGEPVFISPVASGLLTGSADMTTPTGSFVINYKRPSRHMVHGERFGANGNELFGVPWVSYFTDTGIAFHGTYWHNDFTRPRSHGCINLPIQAAKWVYLWSYPAISPRQEKHVSPYGTLVEII